MTLNKRYLNIACGDVFVKDSVWVNLDYNHVDENVQKCNLLDTLPFFDNSVDVIYSSHFFEHIPRPDLLPFLKECNRVLKPGGVLRLVMPDFYEMCSEYIQMRTNSEHQKADFLMIEILDQCVRKTKGGELAQYYRNIDPSDSDLNQYIQTRTGQGLSPKLKKKNKKSFSDIIRIIYKNGEQTYCKLVTKLLPKSFRVQNISYSDIGEKHMWLYDFFSVETLLKKTSFIDTVKMSANTSQIQNFNFYPLDLDEEGNPRKGRESMYIECRKA